MKNKDMPVKEEDQPSQKRVSQPDDQGNIQIDCHIKIFDPNTKETILESRA